MQAGDYLAILNGALIALAVTLPAIAMGIPLGLALALIRWRNIPILSAAAAVFVSFFRATPSVTLVLLIYYAAPSIGVQLPELPAGILTLLLGTTAYNCEIWRASLLAFPKDQFDAALSLGMTRATRFRLIVLPQVARASLPALVNEMTLMIKVSPAIAVIGLVEITRSAVRVGAETYQPLPPFIFALVIYIAIIGCLVFWQRMLEHRQSRRAA
ncbi:MAG TPA: amino acid ABC transporter permease [Acidocella sp.]|nr:amino acid ABC transporter permease [Acidocella sp.]